MSLRIDLRVNHSDNMGVYYSETKRAVIYLSLHESLDDITKTINHEVYHHCFSEAGETERMDEDMEERLIYCIQWAEESIA